MYVPGTHPDRGIATEQLGGSYYALLLYSIHTQIVIHSLGAAPVSDVIIYSGKYLDLQAAQCTTQVYIFQHKAIIDPLFLLRCLPIGFSLAEDMYMYRNSLRLRHYGTPNFNQRFEQNRFEQNHHHV